MEIVAIELPHAFGTSDAQLARLRQVIVAITPPEPGVSRLLVLPETCFTGYVSQEGNFDLSHFGETLDGKTGRAISALAKEHGVGIVGPFVERVSDGASTQFFNTTLALNERGERIATYRKRHPWYPETWASPGDNDVPTFTFGDRTCAICVCFDVHFVHAESSAALDRADVLLFPSAWVESATDDEDDDRRAILARLARAHHVAVVNANWGVGLPAVRGQGGSLALDRNGVTVGERRVVLGVPTLTCRL